MFPCPPDDVLEQLLAGDTPAPEKEKLWQHIHTCPACQGTLDSLSDDAELRQWVPAGGLPEPPPDTVVELSRLLAEVNDLSPGSKTQGDCEPASLSCLGPPRRPGDIGSLGPYIVVAELGRGGMGVGCRAIDESLRRTVAIKILRPTVDGAACRVRCLREAQAAARLRDDHVVQVYAVVHEPPQLPYLVMEHIEGPTLAARIHRE